TRFSRDWSSDVCSSDLQVPQGKDNSIYVMAAPADKPRIAVVAVMEHAGFGSTWAGPASTVIAEKYLTGDLKREHLYKKMVNASFMPEYRRQWISDLKRKGLYRESDKDSIFMHQLEDSIKTVKDSNRRAELIYKRDSIKARMNIAKPKNRTK